MSPPRSDARWLSGALVLIGASLATGRARAEPSDAQLRAARDLFTAAERDEDGARWADALDKLQRVAQVRLTAGVRYHIALCEDHLGRLVLALADYSAAEEQARADGAQDVLRLVGPQLAALGPRVPRLTIRLLPEVSGAQVKLDGTPIGRDAVGTQIPVDPGEHRAEATSPGRPAAAANVVLHEGETTSVDLRIPEPSPAASAAARSPATDLASGAESASRGESRAGAILTTTVAAALAGAGVAAFMAADAQHSSAVAACANEPSPAGCDTQKNAVRAWDYAAAGAWLGAAAVGTVAVLLWLKPARGPAASVMRLVVGPGVVAVGGRF
jgi:hypothetical protein